MGGSRSRRHEGCVGKRMGRQTWDWRKVEAQASRELWATLMPTKKALCLHCLPVIPSHPRMILRRGSAHLAVCLEGAPEGRQQAPGPWAQQVAAQQQSWRQTERRLYFEWSLDTDGASGPGKGQTLPPSKALAAAPSHAAKAPLNVSRQLQLQCPGPSLGPTSYLQD